MTCPPAARSSTRGRPRAGSPVRRFRQSARNDGRERWLPNRRLPMNRMPVIVLLVLMMCQPISALAQSTTPAAPEPSSPTTASGDFAGLVDIGGRSLYLECHGTGSPTVILVAGYR